MRERRLDVVRIRFFVLIVRTETVGLTHLSLTYLVNDTYTAMVTTEDSGHCTLDRSVETTYLAGFLHVFAVSDSRAGH